MISPLHKLFRISLLVGFEFIIGKGGLPNEVGVALLYLKRVRKENKP